MGPGEQPTNVKNDGTKPHMTTPVNETSKDREKTKIKAERPVCEPTTVVLGALDAVTSQIKITSYRGVGGVAGVVGGRVTPFLACSWHVAGTRPRLLGVGCQSAVHGKACPRRAGQAGCTGGASTLRVSLVILI